MRSVEITDWEPALLTQHEVEPITASAEAVKNYL